MMDMTCVENVALAVRLALEMPEAQGTSLQQYQRRDPVVSRDMLDEALRFTGS